MVLCLLTPMFSGNSYAKDYKLENGKFNHALSLFSTAKYSSHFQSFDYVNPDAPKGGEIRFGSVGQFTSLNPFILKGIPASGLSYLYDSLTESSEDEIATRYGLIAQSIKFDRNVNSIEFKLRPEAYFHDGHQVTAQDVIFTFKIIAENGHPSYKINLRQIDRIEKINDHQVKFYLKKGSNRDLPLLIASLPILPKHYYQNHNFNETNLQPPLGSGPYKIKQIKANNSIEYERVKDYWAKNLPVNRGRYNFDRIVFDYYRDNDVAIEAFKGQKYDFRQENVARNWNNAYNIEAVSKKEIIKEEISHALPAPMQAFVWNLRQSKFQNLALRKALTYAFDFEWLNHHIFYGAYKRTESYFANSSFAYQDFHLPKTNGTGFNRDNLIKAKEILTKAGYKISKGRLIEPNSNLPVKIEFLIDQKVFEMVIAPFVKNLAKLGIEAKIKLVEENQYQNRVNNFDYDAIVAVFPQSLIPGDELFAYFHSSQSVVKGSKNLMGLNDERIDHLVELIAKENDRNRLKKLCLELDQIMLESYYLLPQWHNNSHRILYKNIFVLPKIRPKYGIAIDSWYSTSSILK